MANRKTLPPQGKPVTRLQDKNEFTEERLHYLATVRSRLDTLPGSSEIKRAVPKTMLDDIARRIESTSPNGLQYGPWPPVFSFLANASDEDVAELDADLRLVRHYVKESKANDVTQFLSKGLKNRTAEWYGGLFDLWVRASVLRAGYDVEFDVPIDGCDRDSDIRVKVYRRHIRIENTVLGESDEDRKSFERFLEAKKLEPETLWQRPGKFDNPDARGPSLYYDTLRLYAKVYDKIAYNLDPNQSQCSNEEPNILLVSFSGALMSCQKYGWGWALDELFDDQPSVCGRIVRGPGLTDISLDAWLRFTLDELVRDDKRDRKLSPAQRDARVADYQRIIAAPRRLGGIIVFRNCNMLMARINYNAHPQCAVSHAEMAQLEQVLSDVPGYWL